VDIETQIRVINHMIDALALTPEQINALYQAQWWLLGCGDTLTSDNTALLHEIAEPLQGTTAGLVLQDIL
jgi:hypothetical protein